MDGMGAADVGYAGLGKTEKSYLALLDQITYRPGHILHRHLWIDTVLIQKVNVIGLESLERAFDGLTDILRPASSFGADLLSVLETKAKFGADDHLVAPVLERPAEQLLVGEGTIALGRIEEGASDLDGTVQCSDRFLLIGRTIGLAHGHTTETDRGYLESLTAKLTFAQNHECCPPIKFYTALI